MAQRLPPIFNVPRSDKRTLSLPVPAQLSSVPQIMEIARRETDTVGFLTGGCVERHIRGGNCLAVYDEVAECLVAFLVHGPLKPNCPVRVHQVAVGRPYRRCGVGSALVSALASAAALSGCTSLQLACAAPLEANDFWHSCGFFRCRTEQRENRRSRAVHTYRLTLTDSLFAESDCQLPLP